MDGEEPVLHVRTGAQGAGRTDENAHLALADLFEQGLFPLRILFLRGEHDLVFRNSQVDEPSFQIGLDVPLSGRRGRRVAEHELCGLLLGMLPPDLVDLLGADLHLAAFHGLDVRIGHVEQFRIETDFPAVVRDVEHVIVRRVNGSVAHQFGPFHQRVDGLFLRFGGFDRDGHHLAVRHVEVELVGGQQVRVVVERAHQLGKVMEFREPLLDLVSAAFRLDFDAFDDAAVRVGPAGERLHALRLEQVGSEVALHVVQLGHGIGYRRAGREHDVASMSCLAQVLALVEQVLAFLRGRDVHAGHADRGGDGEVLVLVGFVDEQHVHAEVLEVDPLLAFPAVAQRLEFAVDAHAVLLGLFDGFAEVLLHFADLVLQLLRGEVVAVRLRGLDAVEHLRLTPFEILLTAFGTDVHALERVLPDDDRVPVAGGDFGPEACRALAGAVGLRHGQDVRVRVERQIVLRPLFGQMVRYDDHRLGGPAESFRLVAGGHAGEGLACAHDVRDECALLGLQDPRDGLALVRIQVDVGADAGECEIGAVVFARVDAVEPFVVHVLQHAGAVRVGPHPFRERLFDGVALLVQQRGGLRVADPSLPGRVVRVGFGEVAGGRVERSGHDLERVASRSGAQTVFPDGFLVEFRSERRVDLPVAGRLVMADRKAPHAAVGDVGLLAEVECVDHEVADHSGRDPRGAEFRGDVVVGEAGGQRSRESFVQGLQALETVRVRRFGRMGVHPCVPAASPLFQAFHVDHLVQWFERLLVP